MAPFDRPYMTFYLSAIKKKQFVKRNYRKRIGHCKYSSYLVPFSNYLALNNIVTLKSRLGVTEGGNIQKLGYGFLFAFHSNYGSILHYF